MMELKPDIVRRRRSCQSLSFMIRAKAV